MRRDFDDPDTLLMVSASKGDVSAFGQVYERYKNPIMGYLKTILQDERTAEELTQETFLKAYRSRETYVPTAKVSTWLFTIAKNGAYDYLSKKKENLIRISDDEESDFKNTIEQIESPLLDSEAQLIQEVDRMRIDQCISKLSPRERSVVGLRMFSDMNYEDIASQVDVPVGTVKTLLFRAKEKLKICFKAAGERR